MWYTWITGLKTKPANIFSWSIVREGYQFTYSEFREPSEKGRENGLKNN